MSDDDIIELTEVVSPGVQKGQPAGPGPDFGADLDDLLKEMDDGANTAAVHRQAMPGTMNLGTRPSDGHAVNPNEEIELPSLSDLDALLEELGVDDAPKLKAAAAHGFDELDGVDKARPATQADIDIESIIEDAAMATAPPSQQPVRVQPAQPAQPVQPRPAAPAPTAPAAPQQVRAQVPPPPQAAPVPPVAPPADDGIDMNELDAMLNKVLSVAPQKRAVKPVAVPASDRDVGSMLDEAAVKQSVAVPDAGGDDDILDLGITAAIHAPVAARGPVAAEGAAMPPAGSSQVEELEKQLKAVKAETAELASQLRSLGAASADQDRQEKLFEAMKTENVELKVLLSALQADLSEMRANIERYAARAAARVIREELSTLAGKE